MKSMEEMMAAAQKAAETIQNQMGEAQAKLDTIEVEGNAGGGMAAKWRQREPCSHSSMKAASTVPTQT